MKKRIEPGTDLLVLAARQGGCLTWTQCAAHGLTRSAINRLLAASWTRTASGIYCIQPPDWMARAWTGLLAVGPGAVVGSHAAAFLDGLIAQTPQDVVIWSPVRSFRKAPHSVTFRRGNRRGHGSPPRTWPEESALDAAKDCDADGYVALIAAALSSGRVNSTQLLDAARARSRQRHRQLILDMCMTLPGVESALESRYVRNVVRDHGLPEGERQVWLGRTRVDCLIAEYGLIVELDGRAHHEHRRFRDMGRDNANLVDRGLVTLRYGWHDVATRPCSVARQLASILHRRGWDGRPRPCKRCREPGPQLH